MIKEFKLFEEQLKLFNDKEFYSLGHSENFLYHVTNIRNLNSIQKYGILPYFGDTVRNFYSDYYEFDEPDEDENEDDRKIPIYQQPRGGMMPEALLDDYKKPFKVAGCGFGFIGIKSGVFEKMKRPWFGPVPVPNIDEETGEKTEDFILVGEDLSWCTKAINSGFEIWVDPDVRVTHQKTFPLPFMSQMQK